MAISEKDLLLYKIDEGTNNNINFLNYMNDLIKVLTERNIKNPLLIMDNCTIHLKKALIDFYKENKLTIIPYGSELYAIELVFNFIKQKEFIKKFLVLSKNCPNLLKKF